MAEGGVFPAKYSNGAVPKHVLLFHVPFAGGVSTFLFLTTAFFAYVSFLSQHVLLLRMPVRRTCSLWNVLVSRWNRELVKTNRNLVGERRRGTCRTRGWIDPWTVTGPIGQRSLRRSKEIGPTPGNRQETTTKPVQKRAARSQHHVEREKECVGEAKGRGAMRRAVVLAKRVQEIAEATQPTRKAEGKWPRNATEGCGWIPVLTNHATNRKFCAEPPSAKHGGRPRRNVESGETASRVIDPPATGVVGVLWEAYTALKAKLGVFFVQRFVETSFDTQEFISGARHAFFTVNDLFARQRVEELQPMLSRRVHEAFEKTLQDLKHDGLRMEFAIGQVHRVVLTGVNVQPEGAVRGMTVEEDAEGDVQPPGWLTVGVRYDCTAHCKILDADGNTVSSTQDNRGHQWSFARMLPTKLPTEELQSPWRVVDVDIDALSA